MQFFKTHVTPQGWDVKGGIPQNACWRLGCGEARQMLKHGGAIPKRQPFKGTQKKCNQMVPSMCTAKCGSMEAKALSFVLRAAGSEHHMSSTRRAFTYVVGGRVGMNDTCYYTLDMQKLASILPYSTLLISTLLYYSLLFSTLLYSTLLFSTIRYSTLLFYS